MGRTRSRFPVRRKNSYLWQNSAGSFSAQAAGAAALNFSSVGTLTTTMLRMRGEVVGFLDSPATVGQLIEVAYGIILVPVGSGTTVQFDPITDVEAPWLLWGVHFLGYEEMVTDVIDVPVITGFRDTIDNKAKRIIRPEMEMQFVVKNTTVFSSDSINFAYSLRWLQLTAKR